MFIAHANPAKTRVPINSLDREIDVPSSSVQSELHGRAEVIMTHTPETLYACKAYGRPVEKSATSLAFDSADI